MSSEQEGFIVEQRVVTQHRNKFYKPVVSGSIAGFVGFFGTLPFDYIKQQLQSSKPLDWKLIREKPLVLFRGGIVGCTSIVPQMTIKFAVNDYLRRTTDSSTFVNGFIAGYVDGSFLGPVLSLQSLRQMRVDFSYADAMRQLRHQSIAWLTVPMALRNATFTSALFGGHAFVTDGHRQSFLANLAIASVINVPATMLCSPFDVVRAKQINRLLAKENTNVFYIAHDIYRTSGARGFYQGYLSLYINFALRFPLTFALYNTLMERV